MSGGRSSIICSKKMNHLFEWNESSFWTRCIVCLKEQWIYLAGETESSGWIQTNLNPSGLSRSSHLDGAHQSHLDTKHFGFTDPLIVVFVVMISRISFHKWDLTSQELKSDLRELERNQRFASSITNTMPMNMNIEVLKCLPKWQGGLGDSQFDQEYDSDAHGSAKYF